MTRRLFAGFIVAVFPVLANMPAPAAVGGHGLRQPRRR